MTFCGCDRKVVARQVGLAFTVFGGVQAVVENGLQVAVCAGYFAYNKGWFGVSAGILALRPIVRCRSAWVSAARARRPLLARARAAATELLLSALLLDILFAVYRIACGRRGRLSNITESVKVLSEKRSILIYTSIPQTLLTAYIIILQFTTGSIVPTPTQAASLCVSVASIAAGVAGDRWLARSLGREGRCATYAFMGATFLWTFVEVAARTLAVALFASGYKGWVFVALAAEWVLRAALLLVFRAAGCGSRKAHDGSDVPLRALRQLLAHEVMRYDDAAHHVDRFVFVLVAVAVQTVFILGPAYNDVVPGIAPPLAGSGIVPPPVTSGVCWLADYGAPNTAELFTDVANATLLQARCNHGASWGNDTQAAWAAGNHSSVAPLVALAGDAAFREVHRLPALFVAAALLLAGAGFALYAAWQACDALYDVEACSARARAAGQERRAAVATAAAAAAAATSCPTPVAAPGAGGGSKSSEAA